MPKWHNSILMLVLSTFLFIYRIKINSQKIFYVLAFKKTYKTRSNVIFEYQITVMNMLKII